MRQDRELPDKRHVPPSQRWWKGAPYERSPGRWSGTFDYKGQKRNPGTHDTPRQWQLARQRLTAELDGADNGSSACSITIAEFVGPSGEGWPWNYPTERRRKDRTFRHLEQQIRHFVREHGHRPLMGGFSRPEARRISVSWSDNRLSAVRAMYHSAMLDFDDATNPFAKLGRSKTKGRRYIDVLSEAEFELLRACCSYAHGRAAGTIIEGHIVGARYSGWRPGEGWALQFPYYRPEDLEATIAYAVDDLGNLGSPKNSDERIVAVAPQAVEFIAAMPRVSAVWVLPTPAGEMMRPNNWAYWWHPVRSAFTARLPKDHWLHARIARAEARRAEVAKTDPKRARHLPTGQFDLYELKHLAATWLVEPPPTGLGLSDADAATQLGHTDGGKLVRELYSHRDERAALTRIKVAMQSTT
jgi:hypothetical protein